MALLKGCPFASFGPHADFITNFRRVRTFPDFILFFFSVSLSVKVWKYLFSFEDFIKANTAYANPGKVFM